MNEENYIIKKVTYRDYIPLLSLYYDFYVESQARDILNFDKDHTIAFFNQLLDDENVHMAIVCMLGDVIIGFFMGSLSSMPFSSTLLGFERGFFVRKESRGGRAAYMLRDAYDVWAKSKGAVATIDTIFHSEDNETTFKFMEKSGRRVIGKVFERVL